MRVGVALFALTAGLVLPAGARADAVAGSCTAVATTALVRQFVARYNSADATAADRLFAPAPRFQWFSSAQRAGDAKDRATLRAYFRSRALVHERLRIVTLGAGYEARRHLVQFGGKLIRTADDRRTRIRPQDFKGSADCVSGRPRFIVWSM